LLISGVIAGTTNNAKRHIAIIIVKVFILLTSLKKG
jgi:hypothetical protein